MPRYFFDLETNGFLEVTDRVHSLVLQDMDTGEITHALTSPPTFPFRKVWIVWLPLR